eukprot:gene3387-4696_t
MQMPPRGALNHATNTNAQLVTPAYAMRPTRTPRPGPGRAACRRPGPLRLTTTTMGNSLAAVTTMGARFDGGSGGRPAIEVCAHGGDSSERDAHGGGGKAQGAGPPAGGPDRPGQVGRASAILHLGSMGALVGFPNLVGEFGVWDNGGGFAAVRADEKRRQRNEYSTDDDEESTDSDDEEAEEAAAAAEADGDGRGMLARKQGAAAGASPPQAPTTHADEEDRGAKVAPVKLGKEAVRHGAKRRRAPGAAAAAAAPAPAPRCPHCGGAGHRAEDCDGIDRPKREARPAAPPGGPDATGREQELAKWRADFPQYPWAWDPPEAKKFKGPDLSRRVSTKKQGRATDPPQFLLGQRMWDAIAAWLQQLRWPPRPR